MSARPIREQSRLSYLLREEMNAAKDANRGYLPNRYTLKEIAKRITERGEPVSFNRISCFLLGERAIDTDVLFLPYADEFGATHEAAQEAFRVDCWQHFEGLLTQWGIDPATFFSTSAETS